MATEKTNDIEAVTVLRLTGSTISDGTSDGDQSTAKRASLVADEHFRSHGRTHSERFATILNSGTGSDITLLAGSAKIPFKSHKIILRIASPFFEDIFMKYPDSKVFHFPELKMEDVDLFLKFLYMGILPLEITSAIPLLSISKLCVLDDLGSHCEELLKNDLSVEGVFQLYEQAVIFSITHIENRAMEFICRNGQQLIDSREFISLKASTLCAILGQDSLQVDNEIQIFDAAVKWANYQLEFQGNSITGKDIRSIIDEFISLIRFPLMSPEDFSVRVATSQILTPEEVVSILLYFNVPASQRAVMEVGVFNTQPRNHTVIPELTRASPNPIDVTPCLNPQKAKESSSLQETTPSNPHKTKECSKRPETTLSNPQLPTAGSNLQQTTPSNPEKPTAGSNLQQTTPTNPEKSTVGSNPQEPTPSNPQESTPYSQRKWLVYCFRFVCVYLIVVVIYGIFH